jgi:cobalt-zinc-cadmium efflux system outer membrane protein
MELSQRLELGGKRSSRVAIARTDTREAELASQVRRLEVVRDTRIAFHTLQVAQERLRLTREAEALARQVHQAVLARIEAGKVSPIEGARTQVALNAAERRARLAEREVAQARPRLSGLWGGDSATDDITPLSPLPVTLALPTEDTSHSPELNRLALKVERARAGVQASQAGTVPDITLRVGTKREAVTQDQSLLAGVSLPLPLFNRNQGERRAAHAELNVAEANLAAEKLQVEAEIISQRQQLEAAYAEAMALQGGVLGTAEQAFAASQEGYRAGKFGLLELLDTQRALIEARNAYLDSLLSYFQSQAALDRLLGRDVTVSGDAP